MAKPDREELNRQLEHSERKRRVLQNLLAKSTVEDDTLLWSMADLMTLLLLFFILFYSQAITKKASAQEQEPVRQTVTAYVDYPSISRTVPAHSDPAPAARDEEVAPARDESLERVRRELVESVSGTLKKDFSARWDHQRLVLVLGERVTFNNGDADLLEDFQSALQKIATAISTQSRYRVVVAGHTDDTPISSARFPSNWELSAARAVNVARFLITHGVDAGRVSIEGYSEYHPLVVNTSPDNKRANRRVEITLIRDTGEKSTS